MVLISEKNHIRTSKLILNKNALKFKVNVEEQIHFHLKQIQKNNPK